MVRQETDALTGKKLVILGLARQGTALARFAAARGARVFLSDMRTQAQLGEPMASLAGLPITFELGRHPLSMLDGADYLAISGGVPADAPFVQAARARGIPIINDSLLFLGRCPATTIGITGAAGKSTTTALTGKICVQAGRKTWVGGNIGHALIADLDEITAQDIVVQELSSFQLELWDRSPQIAAVLNITPNHLDRHKTLAAYAQAKANILRYQTANDIAVLPSDGLAHLQPLVAGRLRHFGLDADNISDGATVVGQQIVLRDGERQTPVCSLADVHLRGAHNLLNVLAATVLADSAGIATPSIAAAIASFNGIRHRLGDAGQVGGIHFINDSIATAPERVLAALDAIHEPIILLAGGQDKDLDWTEWQRRVPAETKAVVLFGQLAPLLAKLLAAVGQPFVRCDQMEAAVEAAIDLAEAGDVVLLSPGGTSFDAYYNFALRGDHFHHLIDRYQIDLSGVRE